MLYKSGGEEGIRTAGGITLAGFQNRYIRPTLSATGLQDEDFNKPFIGVANSFIEIIPGHFFLDKVNIGVRPLYKTPIYLYIEHKI